MCSRTARIANSILMKCKDFPLCLIANNSFLVAYVQDFFEVLWRYKTCLNQLFSKAKLFSLSYLLEELTPFEVGQESVVL